MKKVFGVLAVVLAMLLAASVGAAWYFSGLIIDGATIKGDDAQFEYQIVSVTPDSGGQTGSVSYRVPDGIENPATDANTVSRVGMTFEDGSYLQLDQGATVDAGVVSRTYDLLAGTAPEPGALGKMDWDSYPDASALGLTQREVSYDAPLGATPAIIVDPAPGAPKSDTWAVVLHGRNGSIREGLRITAPLAQRGLTTMLVNYRDDRKEPGVPAEDGLGNFGSTEWPDAEAAVGYALGNGAKTILLVGWSMGGSVTAAYLENGSNTDSVIGTMLVSPAVSFHAVTVFGAELLGYPTQLMGPIIWMAERFTELRTDIDYSASEYRDNAATWPVPALVTAATEDDLVPPEAIEEFAAALPDGQFELFEGAFHTGEWNLDWARFDNVVGTWLDANLP